MKKNQWMYLVLGCIAFSVISLFLPILVYTYPRGTVVKLNIIDIANSRELTNILAEYTGPFPMEIPAGVATFLAVVAALAILVAFVGAITMSMQRPNTWQFCMTLDGIIGTGVPSLLIFLAVLLSRQYLPGTFRCGIYPVITPISMVVCMVTVTRKHRRSMAELQAQERAKHLIRPGGDL